MSEKAYARRRGLPAAPAASVQQPMSQIMTFVRVQVLDRARFHLL